MFARKQLGQTRRELDNGSHVALSGPIEPSVKVLGRAPFHPIHLAQDLTVTGTQHAQNLHVYLVLLEPRVNPLAVPVQRRVLSRARRKDRQTVRDLRVILQ